MRFIHPAAWYGFFLDCGLVYVLFSTLSSMDFSSLPLEQQQLLALIDSLRFAMFLTLAAQIGAVGLIAMRMRVGLILAAIAAFVMLPAGLLYLIGCVHSHYNWKYAAYTAAPAGSEGAQRVFPAAAMRTMRIACGVGMALAVTTFVALSVDLAGMFLGVALAALYFAVRAGRNPALTLHAAHFTLVPHLMAKRLLIPYTAVRHAVLNPDETIRFQIATPDGVSDLLWPLRSVAPQLQPQALKELGDALVRHDVPLE